MAWGCPHLLLLEATPGSDSSPGAFSEPSKLALCRALLPWRRSQSYHWPVPKKTLWPWVWAEGKEGTESHLSRVLILGYLKQHKHRSSLGDPSVGKGHLGAFVDYRFLQRLSSLAQ